MLALKLDWGLAEVVRNAVLGQKSFETDIFLLNLVTLACGFREDILQPQDLLFKSLDIQLLAFSMGSVVVSDDFIVKDERD